MGVKQIIEAGITRERAKQLLVELVRVPSPQTELFEAEPLLRQFIETAIEPRLRAMGITEIRYDSMGNLISSFGAATTGKSLMFIGNAMNQPQNTMKNAYDGDAADGAQYDLPGDVVLGKGASEQKANLAAMLHAMETVISKAIPVNGKLVFLCCVSGETGRHDAIKNVVEVEGVRADMAMLGGTSGLLAMGNRGRIDVFIKIHGAPCHSSKPHDGCNAVTGAIEVIRILTEKLHLEASHEALGKATWAVNHIQSHPSSTHTIQGRCDITLDRRLLPGDDPEEALAGIKALAMQVDGMKDPASGKPWRVEVEMGPFMYPSLVTENSPIVQLIDGAAGTMLGAVPTRYYAPNAFDQGYLNHMGIPCANYGASEDRYAHTDLDMASVERTADTAKVIAHMIADYLG